MNRISRSHESETRALRAKAEAAQQQWKDEYEALVKLNRSIEERLSKAIEVNKRRYEDMLEKQAAETSRSQAEAQAQFKELLRESVERAAAAAAKAHDGGSEGASASSREVDLEQELASAKADALGAAADVEQQLARASDEAVAEASAKHATVLEALEAKHHAELAEARAAAIKEANNRADERIATLTQ